MTEESNKYVNNLGTFDSIEAVWERYPEGGHEGDYITIAGERLAWDKYSLSWGAAKIDIPSPRQLYELFGDLYSVNNLGTFDSIEAVWERYPEGGHEGDYITIAGERLAWDKYSLSWGAAKTDISSPRQLYELFGDLYVEGDVDVGGKVSANEIEGEENVPSGDIASNLLVKASSAEYAQSQSAINTTKIYYTVEA